MKIEKNGKKEKKGTDEQAATCPILARLDARLRDRWRLLPKDTPMLKSVLGSITRNK